jgi:hypothetical protein
LGHEEVLPGHQALQHATQGARNVVGDERRADVPRIERQRDLVHRNVLGDTDFDQRIAVADEVRPIGQRPDLEDPALGAGVIAAALVFALDER